MANNSLLHLYRRDEALFLEWWERREEFVDRTNALLRAVDPANLGILSKEADYYNTCVGFQWVGAPSKELVHGLNELAEIDGLPAEYRQEARELSENLQPFVGLVEICAENRKLSGHKGVLLISDGHLSTNTPSASGGLSWHGEREEDLLACMPSESALMILGCQAGNTGIAHIGAGSTPGVHSKFCFPDYGIMSGIQTALDADDELVELWENVKGCRKPKAELLRRVDEWNEKCGRLKDPIVRELVPKLVRQRVLGFRLDMNANKPNLHFLPIVSETLYEQNRALVESAGMFKVHIAWNHVVVELPNSYVKTRSVFESAA